MTSTRTGSPASPSSSAPQGAPPCRPSRCLALHSAQEARIRRCLHHLLPKEVPWLQGAQPQGETLHVRRLRGKKGAAKRSLVPKKVLAHSQRRRAKIASMHLHAKTPRCSKRRRAVIPRNKPSTNKRHRWPRQAAAPSPPSYAASHGHASSSPTCPLAMMARRTPQSSYTSTSCASKPPTETKGSWRTSCAWRSRKGPAPGS